MRTTKMNIIELGAGESLQIRLGDTDVSVTVEARGETQESSERLIVSTRDVAWTEDISAFLRDSKSEILDLVTSDGEAVLACCERNMVSETGIVLELPA